MKIIFFIATVFALLNGCSNSNPKCKPYSTRNYITVGKMFDTIQPPYIVDVSEGKKRIVFIGCDHNFDTTHLQFKAIESSFANLQPQIAFNEGGQIAANTHYKNRNEAILADGETGLLKFLSDKYNIIMYNGDMKDSLEFMTTAAKHDKHEMFLYYIIERLAVPYKYGNYGSEPFEVVYNKLVTKYFKYFPLTKAEKSFENFKSIYKKEVGSDFDIENFDLEAFDYINDNCKFCAIGRISKETRDSVLVSKIENTLLEYDRVIVTFGHGHALALEPALNQLIAKYKTK